MKEMEYSTKSKREVLDTGYCLGLLYYIMNLGSHPTAYIKIPKDNKYYGKDMYEIDLEVNGGVTYSSDHLWINENDRLEGWFVGWDYAHFGDYTGFEFRIGGKKWTTEEIFKEVKEACYQLVKGADNIE